MLPDNVSSVPSPQAVILPRNGALLSAYVLLFSSALLAYNESVYKDEVRVSSEAQAASMIELDIFETIVMLRIVDTSPLDKLLSEPVTIVLPKDDSVKLVEVEGKSVREAEHSTTLTGEDSVSEAKPPPDEKSPDTGVEL